MANGSIMTTTSAPRMLQGGKKRKKSKKKSKKTSKKSKKSY